MTDRCNGGAFSNDRSFFRRELSSCAYGWRKTEGLGSGCPETRCYYIFYVRIYEERQDDVGDPLDCTTVYSIIIGGLEKP